METNTLMYNSYNPYGDFNSDIGNIIETEKKVNDERIRKYNEKKKYILPLKENNDFDFQHVSEQITHVLNASFVDVFEKRSLMNLVARDRWVGLGYIFIIIYIVHFISKL